jgi:hypothetical protein
MTPGFRFTIFNDSLSPTGTIVDEPGGWKESRLVLERDPKYHSLIEYFEGEFIWYGSAMALFQAIEDEQGPDAIVRLYVEIQFNENDWEELFDGLIDLSLLEEYSKGYKRYKMKVPIIRNDFWAKFINRSSTPVNLASTTDLDGGERLPIESTTITLPSQVIRAVSDYRQTSALLLGTPYPFDFTSPNFQPDLGQNQFLQIDFDTVVTSEVLDKLSIPAAPTGTTFPVNIFSAKYAGSYDFDVKIALTRGWAQSNVNSEFRVMHNTDGPSLGRLLKMYIQKNQEDPIELTTVDVYTQVPLITKGWTEYTYNGIFELEPGDKITIYGKKFLSGQFGYGNNTISVLLDQIYLLGDNNDNIILSGSVQQIVFSGSTESYLRIEADTVFPETETETFLLPDAAESILSKIVSDDGVLISDTLDGCKGDYSITKGLQVRGYSLEDKPFFLSFDDWWSGADPILNLGLTYDGDNIRIEDKEYFYNPTPSVNIGGITDVVRSYKLENFYKAIEVGYEVWSAESESGIDDPQTKRTYRTRLATIGSDEKNLSKFVAASLAIEQTRRNRVELGKDWRLDENTMIIALKDGVPEVGTDFELITNLLNPNSRYNIRLSCARNFERWRPFYGSSLAHTTDEKFYFASGEGNYDMFSEVSEGDCDYGQNPGLSEKQDIDASDYLFTAKKYTFSHPMNWTLYKMIRDEREKAIGLSRSNDSYTPHFINKLAYSIVGGVAEFDVTLSRLPDEENNFRLLEDDNFRLLEDTNFRLLE